MSDTIKSIGFTVIMCLILSALITGAATGLKGRQVRNMQIDKQKNILKTVGLVEPGKKYSAKAIETLYQESIECLWIDENGRVIQEATRRPGHLSVCLYNTEDGIEAYIVPIDTNGVWGRINGYLSLEKDGSTIAGFTVYKHSETPGLGGEIESAWFQKNFVGKKIVNYNGRFVSIGIAKGRVSDTLPEDSQLNFVDGISGATLTGQYLSAGFKEILTRYEVVSIKFRNNQPIVRPGEGPIKHEP